MRNISHCARHSSYTVSVHEKTVRFRQEIRNNFAVIVVGGQLIPVALSVTNSTSTDLK
jgi:hypothetical protein